MPAWVCYGSTEEVAAFTGADLGFYNGGCPIHLKGAPKVEGWVWIGGCLLSRKFCISYIKVVSFYAFPEIFTDSVTANCYERKLTLAFKLQKINMF